MQQIQYLHYPIWAHFFVGSYYSIMLSYLHHFVITLRSRNVIFLCIVLPHFLLQQHFSTSIVRFGSSEFEKKSLLVRPGLEFLFKKCVHNLLIGQFQEVNEENLHYSSVNGDWALRRAVAKYYNEIYRKGKSSLYTAENVAIVGGGRLALTRLCCAMDNVNLGHFLPDYTATMWKILLRFVNLCYVFFFLKSLVPTKNLQFVFFWGVKCDMITSFFARHMPSSWVSSRPSIPSLFLWIPKTTSPSPCRNFVVKLWDVVCRYSCCQILVIQQVNWLKEKSWRIGCESHEKRSVPWCWMKFIQDISIPNACHPLMPPGEWSQLHNLWMTSIKILSSFWMGLTKCWRMPGLRICWIVAPKSATRQPCQQSFFCGWDCGKSEWLPVRCRLFLIELTWIDYVINMSLNEFLKFSVCHFFPRSLMLSELLVHFWMVVLPFQHSALASPYWIPKMS